MAIIGLDPSSGPIGGGKAGRAAHLGRDEDEKKRRAEKDKRP